MEYCELGSLDKIDRKSLTESEIQWYLAQILLGIEYLHNKKIIHRVVVVLSFNVGS